MKYRFSFSLNQNDLFNSSINYMLHAKTFLFDLIFTCCATILLIYIILTGQFIQMSNLKKILLISAPLVFPVLQPIIYYFRSVNQAKLLKNKIINLSFDDYKVYINIGMENSEVLYENFYNVINYKNMIVMMYDSIHGQIMPERIFNGNKDLFYDFLKNKVEVARNNKKEYEEKTSK